jgi:hypothetical protein
LYRLRIGQIVREYGMFERTEVPADSEEFHKKKLKLVMNYFFVDGKIMEKGVSSDI